MLKLSYSWQTTLIQMSPHVLQNCHKFSIIGPDIQHLVYIIGISVLLLLVFCLIADQINEFMVTLAQIQLTLSVITTLWSH